MKTVLPAQLKMLEKVAEALSEEFLREMVFIGGCTTSLLVDEENYALASRYTYDVDLIVDIATQADWYFLEEKIRRLGFKNDQDSNVICRYKLEEDLAEDIIVDFMPTDSSILGFSNRWYDEAIKHKFSYELPNGKLINLLKSPYFLATKFEAYKGRGGGDAFTSKDIEDILTLCMGRSSLVEEIYNSSDELRDYLSISFKELADSYSFDLVLDDQCRHGSRERAIQVINAIIKKWERAF